MKELTNTGDSSGDFTPAPAGLHVARLYRIVDLGTVESPKYTDDAGNPKKQHHLHFTFELGAELMDNGKPFVVGKRYTASLHPKSNLSGDLSSWRGNDIEKGETVHFEKLLGKYCQVNVIHQKNENDGKTYARIKAVLPLGKNEAPTAVNETLFYDMDAHDEKVFSALPDWMRTRIESSFEWKEKHQQQGDDLADVAAGDLDDDIPF